ncbi:Ig-like domain-containing protein (plasmid) [Latilactobacillus curvatus]|uniref:Ig-like domain-containing protein n=1 Tax=Latilactobacillus curvatus TaxID=28038 RepID=UPI0024B8E50C|nr:Ig-like domain-containing protein [Latilactobacillus curvatus]WHQ79181.1 Ig-like domain-containing protein [Latilactobacillus curvatus]WHQ79311.1 Ig-like domain-containing protein [Latilactobacillus curvatus]
MGATETLILSVTPADATDKTGKWTVDKSAVATVDQNGKAAGITTGTAKAKFTTNDGGFTAECTITVTE